MVPFRGKEQIDVGANRCWRICIDKHAIHGNILAAGNHIVAGMDEINSEVNRVTLNNTSVISRHFVSLLVRLLNSKRICPLL
jgi:hypothetical protein